MLALGRGLGVGVGVGVVWAWAWFARMKGGGGEKENAGKWPEMFASLCLTEIRQNATLLARKKISVSGQDPIRVERCTVDAASTLHGALCRQVFIGRQLGVENAWTVEDMHVYDEPNPGTCAELSDFGASSYGS
ncbi:hypothetical protein B0H11DRAFT_1932276 [Mycena galericulata]|nr:hypothetical protein B0H11DRAFT_1932276 [Mycena galericulata]